MQYVGAYTALLTPFKNGKVDEEKYREFIEWQITEGIDGLVPCGTTGESATLSHKEHEEVIRICIDQVKKRVPVIAGAGSNNTTEAIRLTKFAKEAGADAALHITPYYNKPTQQGLFEHFKAIGAAVDLPIIVYNVPGRTSVNVAPATMARMFKEIPNVVGVKEATGNLAQISDIIEYCGNGLDVLSGDDFTVLPILSIGGSGVISVVSNILPKEMAALCAAFRAGDLAKARKLHYAMMPISRACFVETNPIPVKTALYKMGRMDIEMRLPLVRMQPENEKILDAALKDLSLI
ncbi:4-hydroxy-tetrahydrodipicolinate synthase [uncultured delta proteobacterium]|uniref:4-hydroxy-tetrahydrodipicolinate synthase n=1 Tax=uncultured delta proteobacterium TaxID=34034 RepID=A0A212KEI6_9DELT|nr:4-hydroxy-tetrahydrodipicolinate synthase [uncultured delta proteobacterium]